MTSVMKSVTKNYGISNWEYYLAWTLSVIGILAIVMMALRAFGII